MPLYYKISFHYTYTMALTPTTLGTAALIPVARLGT